MNIVDIRDNFFVILISLNDLTCTVEYYPKERHLIYKSDNLLIDILKDNEYQLRKVLHNKRKDTFYVGFKLTFILRDNDEAVAFNDLSKLIVYDKRKGNPVIKAVDYYENEFMTLFTDGSYSEKKGICSYVALIKNTRNLYDVKFGIKDFQNSSLIELYAVIAGLKFLKYEEKIRIVTDSRYVIKGLTEWIYNWKLNDWYTAQGEKVKHIKYWEEYAKLTENKYVEFDWVKGHSFHFENLICDKYAKELIAREK